MTLSAELDLAELEQAAREIRGQLVKMSHEAQTPHLASALSCVDILVAAYWGALEIDVTDPWNEDRDRLILSKGHAATALYAVLQKRGFISRQVLDSYAQQGSLLVEHPSPRCAPGIEAGTGSLGHGLPIGLGMALAARMNDRSYKICVVMSDGECNEGSVWEAALLAGGQKLERLVAVIDYNKWQATARSNEVMALAPLVDKWRAFGWNACEVDGHDINALAKLLRNVPDGSGRPVAVIAHTVKGKGVSLMEDDNNWHYRIPTAEELAAAKKELGLT